MNYAAHRLGASIYSTVTSRVPHHLICLKDVRGFASFTNKRYENVEVPVGGSGSFSVSISKPLVQNVSSEKEVLVYFPEGTLSTRTPPLQVDAAQISHILRPLWPSATIAVVNYRLSQQARFPTPIHDATLAFDHISSHLARKGESQVTKPRIYLTGSRIGGALATTLALTHPNDVHALAVVEPLVDWVGIDEVVYFGSDSTRESSMTKKAKADILLQTPAAEDLIKLRSKLFRTPSAYFDPFASPTLFLRAPGRDTPLTNTASFDPEAFASSELSYYSPHDAFGPYDDDSDAQVSDMNSGSQTSDFASDVSASTTPPDSELLPRRRKVIRRWPPLGRPEDVLLPYTRVFAQNPGNENGSVAALMRSQGTEFVDLLRRACFFGRERGVAEERASLGFLSPSAEKHVDEADFGLAAAVTWLKTISEKNFAQS